MTSLHIAIIEDDKDTSDLFASWLRELETSEQTVRLDQLFTRDEAESRLRANSYDLICLDIQLQHERNAGIGLIGLIRAVHQARHGPVVVISGAPAETYRPIMSELLAWDYLTKPLSHETKGAFLDTISKALRKKQMPGAAEQGTEMSEGLEIDPLNQTSARYMGKRINLPLTGQRIAKMLADRQGQLVSYAELYAMIPTGHNTANIRAHIQVIRNALRDVDPQFDAIRSVPMAGYMWQS